MSVFNTETLTTEINTIAGIADKSSVEMDTSVTKSSSRKSILKTPTSTFKEIIEAEEDNRLSNNDLVPRPHTLKEYVEKESLNENIEMKSTLSIDDLDENDEIWVVDIPGTIDPLHLKGQILQFGEKSKIKIGADKYSAISRGTKSNFTSVLNADKSSHTYKAVNIKSAGSISIRRKLSSASKKILEYQKTGGVPYPKNIRVRHPLFGITVDRSSVKTEE